MAQENMSDALTRPRKCKVFFGDLQDNSSGRYKKLISGQREITGESLIDSVDLWWISTGLLHSRTYQYADADVYVFSDSVLCLARVGPNPAESWKKQTQWYSETNYSLELNRIDGKPMEFEWKIFPELTTAGILYEIPKTGKSSCQCLTTLHGMQKETKHYVKIIQKDLKSTLEDFLAVVGLSWGPDLERIGTELTMVNQLGIERRRKCCRISELPVTQYSVVPVPWREDN